MEISHTASKLDQLVQDIQAYMLSSPIQELEAKPSLSKWSKKEILGHLIDSAIHNLQRFTEIQFEPKPFLIRAYNQNALVIANAYQKADLQDLLNLWTNLNKRIAFVMRSQNKETIAFEICVQENSLLDLGF